MVWSAYEGEFIGRGWRKKVVSLEQWKQTGEPEVDDLPASGRSAGSLAAGNLTRRQTIERMNREEKQAVLLMFILSPDASDDQLEALLWATGLGADPE